MEVGCFHFGDRYVSCGVHLEWCGVCGVVYTSVKCEHSCGTRSKPVHNHLHTTIPNGNVWHSWHPKTERFKLKILVIHFFSCFFLHNPGRAKR
jgi:hypothetical protein